MSDVITWDEIKVGNWLDDIKLGQYKDIFRENNITGLVLFDLTHSDLKDMGISNLGERAKILLELKKFYYVILNSRDNNISLNQEEIKKNRDSIIQKNKYCTNDLVNNQMRANRNIQSIIVNNKAQHRKTIIHPNYSNKGNVSEYNSKNPAASYRESIKNSGNKRQTIKINKRSSINRLSIGMTPRNNVPRPLFINGYNNFNNMQPSPNKKASYYSIKNKRMSNRNSVNSPLAKIIPRKSIMNKPPVRSSKMISKNFETRASILDIYGGISKFFPVKENDELAKKARETGNRMSMMLEKVEKKLQRLSIKNYSPLKEVYESPTGELESSEENKNNRLTEVSKPNTDSPLSSKSNITENNEKIDDILINKLINSNNKRGTIKPTTANVYKIVIKSQETEKLMKARRSAQKQVVVKKSVANIEFNKDRANSISSISEKSNMISSPLRESTKIESNSIVSTTPKQKPIPIPIKTKMNNLQKIAASHSSSPISANSSKSSPNLSSSKSTSPISAQQRRLADIESGNMSDELKHRTSHIIHIRSPSITINSYIPQDTDSIVLVSPSTIVHTTFDFPIQKDGDKEEENDKTITKQEDKLLESSEQDLGILDESNDKYVVRPGKWIAGKLIGQGSYGKVYYGMNTDNGQIMAIKQVDIKNKMMVDALNAEINLLTGVKHENIVVYFGSEYSEKNCTFSVFLEYVSGGSISSMLVRFGKFGESLIRSLTSQILAGLEYLHSVKIIHRDIKGANILVDEDGVAKISDFGISKKNEYENAYKKFSRMSVKGTVYWMAPEVVKGKGYSAKVDIWSVGCCVLEMFTGTHPWTNFKDVQPVLYKLCTSERPALPNSICDEAKDFIDKSLAIDPEIRPTATNLLKHPFVLNQDENFNFHEYYEEAIQKEKEEEEKILDEDGRMVDEFDDDDDEYEDCEDDEIDDYFEDTEEIDDYFDESAFDDDNMICKDKDDNNFPIKA